MGRGALFAFLGWQASSFLGGYLSGNIFAARQWRIEALQVSLREVARLAVDEARDSLCLCDSPREPSKEREPHRLQTPDLSWGWTFLLVLSALANLLFWSAGVSWQICCNRRRAAPAVEWDESEDSSPDERRASAQRQLALIRNRRHGTGQ